MSTEKTDKRLSVQMYCSFCPNGASFRHGQYRLCDGHYEWALNEGFAWPVEVDCA